MDEQAYLQRLAGAGVDDFCDMLVRASGEEVQALVGYFGEERFDGLHDMALRRSARGRTRAAEGNVVVVHGVFGSELASSEHGHYAHEPLWLDLPALAGGGLRRLRLAADGRSPHEGAVAVEATATMKRHYGELVLALSARWRVELFTYDWRMDLDVAADRLLADLQRWFGDAPAHLVAHGSGGLVARTFVQRSPDRWRGLWDAQGDGRAGGRLVLLGTPNHGSFSTVQTLLGDDSTAAKLLRVDPHRDAAELRGVLASFPSLYHLLPSPALDPSLEALYDAGTWGDVEVSQRHLTSAHAHHALLAQVAPADLGRMCAVVGTGQPTLDGLDVSRMPRPAPDDYAVTLDGDGRVPVASAALRAEGAELALHQVDEQHGGLLTNRRVLAAVDDLLATGDTAELPTAPEERPPVDEARARWRTLRAREAERLEDLVEDTRLQRDGATRAVLTSPRRKGEELVVSAWLGGEVRRGGPVRAPFTPPCVRLRVVHRELPEVGTGAPVGAPVEVIAVGHYLDVDPQAAELALDQAISEDRGPDRTAWLLTQYTQRGILRGRLGEPFFLPDPRPGAGGRLLAIAGMGEPGRFGTPELTVVARELVWSVGRLGKRHLATVLIGSGNGNLTARGATLAWIRGIKHALTGSTEDERHRVAEITFVENDPAKVLEVDDVIAWAAVRLRAEQRMVIDHDALTERERRRLTTRARRAAHDAVDEHFRHGGRPAVDEQDLPPTRVTLTFEGGKFRFGALTETAAVPERDIAVNKRVIEEANDELVGETDHALKRERGTFLSRLLFPDDVASQLDTRAPLVMLLDATTARIHWELAVYPRETRGPGPAVPSAADEAAAEEARLATFLGTSRGFTRQLRTVLAPPPDPPPPPRRVLRVLVVADPAADAHLPGAQEEGVEVADLLERFNRSRAAHENAIEVIRLLGPRRAKLTDVLRQLMLHSFDVLHFAGHCVYDDHDPTLSGWVFTDGQRLTANELQRIDRVPKFVVSNACESGITPDRSGDRSVDLAPSFAESFFARGVSNFVCCAWPVSDQPARVFARHLYGALLGLLPDGSADAPDGPQPMHKAMHQARQAVAGLPDGGRTWGAYQHYGNPHFRLFAPLPAEAPRDDGAGREGATGERRAEHGDGAAPVAAGVGAEGG